MKRFLKVLTVTVLTGAGMFISQRASAQEDLTLPIYGDNQDLSAFVDKNVGKRAVKAGDLNGDGSLSKEEAEALEVLNLAAYRIDPIIIKTYEDLAMFPHLKQVFLGDSELEEVDLSKNFELQDVVIWSDNLKVLILAVGCNPKITFPPHSGEVTIRRVVNRDAPGSEWYY